MRSFEKDDEPEIDKPIKKSISSVGNISIIGEQQVFCQYLEDSAVIRKRYGIGKIGKEGSEKYYIECLDAIKALDPVRKEWLRQWMKDKQRTEQWKT